MFLEKLKRGIVNIVSEEELTKKLSEKKRLRIKFGIDPTSPDLHLGHTVLLRKLRLFQEYGHKIIFIIGDFTARIGDPSGQDKTRPIMTEAEILKNAKTYQEQVFKILDESKTEIVYNSSWLFSLGLQGILELSRHVTVAQMLHRADFKKRFEKEIDITILEFLYPLLQGYDSVAIKSDVELGGTDQLFNLLMGRQIQSTFGQDPQVIITLPLLVGTDGKMKMSKSYKNYIALNDTPKEMYGKIMSLPDDLMLIYFELLTDFDLDEIKRQIKTDPRDAKSQLAYEITKQYHGEKAAKNAQTEFDRIFSKRQLPEEIPVFKSEKKSWRLVELLVASNLALTKNEARRLISQGAVEIDNKKIAADTQLTIDHELVIRAGKRKFTRVVLSEGG
ncbi:MAG: tyrosine--tRNA ligase [Elusimicrobiota bacterium]|nr:tyrosine--tRNA ligase [Elusimicrobiota bacterium]